MSHGGATAVTVALGVALACGPLTAPSLSSAPVNACPDHPCSAYVQAGATPVCNGGACLVTAQLPNLVLVVSLPVDSYFAPGRTFAIPFDHLFDPAPTQACVPPSCTHLPGYGVVGGDYAVLPQTAQKLNWNVGNPDLATSLPVHVTYRPLWQPPGATAPVDAVAAGLPLDLVSAAVYSDNAPNSPPGPAAGPGTAFQANMQPGLYEVTIAPDPPFDVAFPPDVKRISIDPGQQSDAELRTYDTTGRIPESNGDLIIPTFVLTRADGLDGWTAYLRDVTTKRRISTLAALSGTTTSGIIPTDHHPSDKDALTDAELVLVPPGGQPIPTGVFAPTGGELPKQETYVNIPTPATVSGTLTSSVDGSPVEADLVFEATGIYVAGSTIPNTSNFEYVGRAAARIDPATGLSRYSVALPRGQYSLTVRPLTTGVAVTVVEPLDVQADPFIHPLTIDAPQQVEGSATVGDGRPLAGATVEAVPVQCFKGSSLFCRPRFAQTTTQGDGSFMLMLDPGGYVLRVEPPDGTRLPWVVQSIVVGPTQVLVPPIVVPAPVYAGVQLVDVGDNPIVNAVVRVFAVQAQGGAGTGTVEAVEVARAITGSTGHYDVYLDPSAE